MRSVPTAALLAVSMLGFTGTGSPASVSDPAGDANGLHQVGSSQSTDPASYDEGDVLGLELSDSGDAVEARLSLAAVPTPSQQPPMMWYGIRATIDGCVWEFTILSGSFVAEPTDGEAGVGAYLNDLDGCNGENWFLFGDPLTVSIDEEKAALVLTVPFGEYHKGLSIGPGQIWTDIWARTATGNYLIIGGGDANGNSWGTEQELTVGIDETAAIAQWEIPVRD